MLLSSLLLLPFPLFARCLLAGCLSLIVVAFLRLRLSASAGALLAPLVAVLRAPPVRQAPLVRSFLRSFARFLAKLSSASAIPKTRIPRGPQNAKRKMQISLPLWPLEARQTPKGRANAQRARNSDSTNRLPILLLFLS